MPVTYLDWSGYPYPLGRHVEHDDRSRVFAHAELLPDALTSVAWTRRVPIFDQGRLGSCTGNAFAGLVGTDSAGRPGTASITVTNGDAAGIIPVGTHPVDENLAVALYRLATRLDDIPGQYPPQDTGSSGLGAAKALCAIGVARSYSHAFSRTAVRSALQSGPVAVGTVWLESMFNIDGDGSVCVDRASAVAGGHEYVLSAWDATEDMYTIANSWGVSWGRDGYATITGADLAWLLSQDGDVTVPAFTSSTQPPTPVDPADRTLWERVKGWVFGRHVGPAGPVAAALRDWSVNKHLN